MKKIIIVLRKSKTNSLCSMSQKIRKHIKNKLLIHNLNVEIIVMIAEINLYQVFHRQVVFKMREKLNLRKM